jgi:hypothetical protein
MADGLLAVTATHQTGTALQMLAVLSPLLLTLCPARVAIYPDAVPAGAAARVLPSGPRAMRELLELALPGIDANDLEKMGSTLRFFEQVLTCVPLTDQQWAPPAAGAAGAAGADEAELASLGLLERQAWAARLRAGGDGGGAELLEEQAAEAASLSLYLPEFAERMLDQMLTALEHFERLPRRGWEQQMLLLQWRLTALAFWQQLSEPLFASLLPRLLRLLPRSSLIDAVKHVGALLAAATLAQPEATLALAVPQCARALLAAAPAATGTAAAAGTAAAPAPRLQAMSDDEARWWLLLLAQLVRNGGAALLPHMGTLRAVLHAAGRATQPKVLKAAYKLRRRLLQALCSTYLTEFRSLPPRAWGSAALRSHHWEQWGWMPSPGPGCGDAAALDAQWHVPSAAEMEAAEALVAESLERAEALLDKLAPDAAAAAATAAAASAAPAPAAGAGGSEAADAELRACLLELRAVAKGALSFLADSEQEAAGEAGGVLEQAVLPDQMDVEAEGDGGGGGDPNLNSDPTPDPGPILTPTLTTDPDPDPNQAAWGRCRSCARCRAAAARWRRRRAVRCGGAPWQHSIGLARCSSRVRRSSRSSSCCVCVASCWRSAVHRAAWGCSGSC